MRPLIDRIEHFGSTAAPGMAGKPVVDMLIQVVSLDRTRTEIAPVLEGHGYDYVWRSTHGDARGSSRKALGLMLKSIGAKD